MIEPVKAAAASAVTVSPVTATVTAPSARTVAVS